jgi:hypothetical protein
MLTAEPLDKYFMATRRLRSASFAAIDLEECNGLFALRSHDPTLRTSTRPIERPHSAFIRLSVRRKRGGDLGLIARDAMPRVVVNGQERSSS